MATAKRAAASRSSRTTSTDKPKVEFSLSSFEVEGRTDPMPIEIAGKVLHLMAPHLIDYRVLVAVQSDPETFFAAAFSPDDFRVWNSTTIPAQAIGALTDRYQRFYDLGDSPASSDS